MGGAYKKGILEGNELVIQETPKLTNVSRSWADGWRNWICMGREFDFEQAEFHVPRGI